MVLKLANRAGSVLAATIDDSETTVVLTGGDEGRFPSLGAGDWFPITVIDASANRENMRVTARSGVNLTVERGAEGSTARAFDAGAKVELRLTAGAFMAALEELELRDVGLIGYFHLQDAPDGWLEANGDAVARSTYSRLDAKMYVGDDANATAPAFYRTASQSDPADNRSTTGAYLVLPRLGGEFIRGLDKSGTIDPGRTLGSIQASQNLEHNHTTGSAGSHAHTGTANSAGSHTHSGAALSAGAHTHSYTDDRHGGSAGSLFPNGASGNVISQNKTTGSDGAHTHSLSINANGAHTHSLSINANGAHTHTISNSGGSEARPRNRALLACVRY